MKVDTFHHAFVKRVLSQPKLWVLAKNVTSQLDNLCKPGGLISKEPPDSAEFASLKRSGLARLRDADLENLSLDGRFDLAYNAAHALCLAALRWQGYRASSVLATAAPKPCAARNPR